MKIDPPLLIAVLLGEGSEEEIREVEVWRAISPEHEADYRRIAQLWNLAGRMAPLVETDHPAPEEITERARKEAQPPPRKSIPSESKTVGSTEGPDRLFRRRRRPGLFTDPLRHRLEIAAVMAAVLVVGLGIGMAVEWENGGPSRSEVLATGVDDVATLTLRDETVVHLAPRSRLVFSREGNVREVSLSGRAYFAVMPDPDHPFRVRLPGGEVEVLGTRFDVESRDDGMQVTVVDGNVRMATRGARLNVGASQVGRVSQAGVPVVENVEDVYEIINWLGQFLAFESTPMEEIVVELERRFGIRIDIADSELRRRTVTGWFADQSPEAMVAAICTVVEARCSMQNGRIRMELTAPAGERAENGTPVGDRSPVEDSSGPNTRHASR